jgi:hypothetical protein
MQRPSPAPCVGDDLPFGLTRESKSQAARDSSENTRIIELLQQAGVVFQTQIPLRRVMSGTERVPHVGSTTSKRASLAN